MKKRRKKTPRQKIEKSLDELSKTCAKVRDHYTCQKCGKQGEKSQIHGSHVIPVSAGKRLRWDLQNIKALCAYCHRRWWHSHPLEAAEWFKNTFFRRWEYLQREKIKGPKKWSIEELEELEKKLKETLESRQTSLGVDLY